MAYLPLPVQYKSLRENHPLPTYGSAGAACADVFASVQEPIYLAPGESALVPLGFAVAMPQGWELQVRPRSGLAAKGVIVANSPGCVDEDYRGEVKAIIRNLGTEILRIEDRMRIAQICPVMVTRLEFRVTDTLSDTERGAGGFGSTGT